MFVDRVTIEVRAGNGGSGVVAWRREKYIPKGGPSGGDGGKGGSVTILVDSNVDALDWFKHTRIIQAPHGGQGQGGCRKGKDGQNVILKVPPGTQIKDVQTKELLFDAKEGDGLFVLCQGGKGGKGNFRFRSSTNRAPNQATPGIEGGIKNIELELKLIADVGLVGFPNAGKSSLLSVLCHRHVAIAPYPFTTLTPNLGFIHAKGGKRIVLADIPGIIEGAHENRGLGLDFLRHIERTKVLIYVLDAAGVDGRDPLSDYHVLQKELKKHKSELLARPFCIILNKIDIEGAQEHVDAFRKEIAHDYIFEVSCVEKQGLPAIFDFLVQFS
jgi:GTP-binding protein